MFIVAVTFYEKGVKMIADIVVGALQDQPACVGEIEPTPEPAWRSGLSRCPGHLEHKSSVRISKELVAPDLGALTPTRANCVCTPTGRWERWARSACNGRTATGVVASAERKHLATGRVAAAAAAAVHARAVGQRGRAAARA